MTTLSIRRLRPQVGCGRARHTHTEESSMLGKNRGGVKRLNKAWYLVLLALVTSNSYGQNSTAIFGGRIFDSQSRVIRHAAVTVTSVETGNQWQSTTNNDGDWRVQALPVGHYRFQVTAPGFKTLEHAPIELQVFDQNFVDATLSIGTATDTVTVDSTTPLIETTATRSAGERACLTVRAFCPNKYQLR